MLSGTTLSEILRVLVVDDHAGMIARAAAVLTPRCSVVGTATDGVTALAAAADLQPDVIVLDISMPGMNGFEVAERLRASGCSAAVVFLSAYDDEEFVTTAWAVGGTAYVLKRRLSSELLNAVLNACGRRGHRPPSGSGAADA